MNARGKFNYKWIGIIYANFKIFYNGRDGHLNGEIGCDNGNG